MNKIRLSDRLPYSPPTAEALEPICPMHLLASLSASATFEDWQVADDEEGFENWGAGGSL